MRMLIKITKIYNKIKSESDIDGASPLKCRLIDCFFCQFPILCQSSAVVVNLAYQKPKKKVKQIIVFVRVLNNWAMKQACRQ